MNIKETEHFIEVKSTDNQGEYTFRIQKDCSQIQIETGFSEAFIDTNLQEVIAIRDSIAEAIECVLKKK